MSEGEGTTVVLMGEAAQARLELTEFARACGTTTAFVEELILEGVLPPRTQAPAPGFSGDEVARVRRVLRLQRDFDATLASAAVMLDLLDEIERLRASLRRAGVDAA
jgi:chaperone modulatory protein CbpM